MMHVESSSEVLKKIHSLQEISDLMKQAGLKSTNLIFGKALQSLSITFFRGKKHSCSHRGFRRGYRVGRKGSVFPVKPLCSVHISAKVRILEVMSALENLLCKKTDVDIRTGYKTHN